MTKVRVTVEPVPVNGLVVAKGNRPPDVWTHECEVPNLQIVNSPEAQRDFDANHLQIRVMAHGDIKEAAPKIQPNATLGTQAMFHGKIVDAGTFDPLTPDEITQFGQQGDWKGWKRAKNNCARNLHSRPE